MDFLRVTLLLGIVFTLAVNQATAIRRRRRSSPAASVNGPTADVYQVIAVHALAASNSRTCAVFKPDDYKGSCMERDS